jgi:hypothetical protein
MSFNPYNGVPSKIPQPYAPITIERDNIKGFEETHGTNDTKMSNSEAFLAFL